MGPYLNSMMNTFVVLFLWIWSRRCEVQLFLEHGKMKHKTVNRPDSVE